MGAGSKGSSQTVPFGDQRRNNYTQSGAPPLTAVAPNAPPPPEYLPTNPIAQQAYQQMMGGGNNWGGIIRPGPPASQPPPTTPPAPTYPAATTYGVWQPARERAGGAYMADLPYGLAAMSGSDPNGVQDQYGQIIDPITMKNTGLQWDRTTGHVVGGDEQLQGFQNFAGVQNFTPEIQNMMGILGPSLGQTYSLFSGDVTTPSAEQILGGFNYTPPVPYGSHGLQPGELSPNFTTFDPALNGTEGWPQMNPIYMTGGTGIPTQAPAAPSAGGVGTVGMGTGSPDPFGSLNGGLQNALQLMQQSSGFGSNPWLQQGGLFG